MSRKPIRAGIRPSQGESGAEALTERLKDVFSRWATGVTVVATRDAGDVIATTATAFTPLSLEPALVLICLGANALVLPFLEPGARYSISILGEDQQRAASMAADPGPLARTLFPPDGDPVIPDAVAVLHCTVDEVLPRGDHHIVIGAVDDAELGPEKPPLLYFQREYRRLG
ncbi:MAG TPA: flavin reductase family protein [Longimicrobiales bacterium]|nr:flavin reductase family protein [Longimicrobiales bacterium]